MTDFQATEETAIRLRKDVANEYYVKGGNVKQTPKEILQAPFEFLAAPGPDGGPINLLIHDVAGEQLVDRDDRLDKAPAIMWSDVVMYFYNPEESPALRFRDSEIEQSVVLNGVRDDIESSNSGVCARGMPPLVVLLCKCDLVPNELLGESDLGNADRIQSAIKSLDDADVVSAGRRWPEAHWLGISAQPADGSEPRGILEAITLVTSLIRDSR